MGRIHGEMFPRPCLESFPLVKIRRWEFDVEIHYQARDRYAEVQQGERSADAAVGTCCGDFV